jgi:hypothetical protein
LLDGHEPLSFLVRRSRFPGSYAITIAAREGGVRHTLIKPIEYYVLLVCFCFCLFGFKYYYYCCCFRRNGEGYLFAGQRDDMPFDDIPELVKFLIRSKALGSPILPQ